MAGAGAGVSAAVQGAGRACGTPGSSPRISATC
eukprot:g13867.t1